MAGGPTRPGRSAHRHPVTVGDVELRQLVPYVLSVLVRRGADFATAEDAMQEALIRAISAWEDEVPSDPTGWLITVAWRAFLDMTRSDTARRDREVRFDTEPPVGAVPSADDTLRLYFLCAHPNLTSSSAVALTLRARGWPHHTPDRAGLPRARAHHGAAHQPRQAHGQSGRCRSSRRRAHGDAGVVPRVQRGLLGRRRSRGRGDPTDPAVSCLGGRPRGPRVARPDALTPCPPPQPHPTGRKHRAAR